MCFVSLLLVLSGCKDDDVEVLRGRTVLAYMIASDLDYALTNNIEEMIIAATASNLRGGSLVVFYSKNKDSAELFEIKEGKDGHVTRHHIRDYEGKSAISPAVMREIINEVISLYPNDHYGLILSSHGTSWLPADYNTMFRSFGEENKKKMEIYELAAGIPDHVFDFLLFDACSMGSVECMYELKDKADYIIASPSETMRYGFPFKDIIPSLFTPIPDLEKVIANFYSFYLHYSDPYGNISITKTSGLDDLANITREIISTADENNVIYTAPFPDWQVLSNLSGSPTKLYDFEDVISRIATKEQLPRLTVSMTNVITGKYYTEEIYCRQEGVIPVTRFSGLSVYPLQTRLTQLNDWYKRLKWYKAVYE
jgi:hypothetical protein